MTASDVARLTVSGASKDYAVRVLDEVDFELRAGEIHALVGANGAGKSTLCKIISGLVPASSGTMKLDGIEYRPASKLFAESRGVQIVQQELNLVSTLTVAENVMMGRWPHRFGILRRNAAKCRAREALGRIGMDTVDVDTLAGDLGVGHQQMIEIAAALDRDCRVLILDEPTAALSASETDTLFDQLRRLRDAGVGIIYISHRLEEVTSLADRITILRDGTRVDTQPTAQVSVRELVSKMVGSEIAEHRKTHRDFTGNQVRFRVDGLSRSGVYEDIRFEVRDGERLGIAGLVGSGRTELLRGIFGADIADAGWVETGGTRRRFRSPHQAVRQGLAMVTEDRKDNGLLLTKPIRMNMTLCDLPQLSFGGWLIRHQVERDACRNMRSEMEIQCRDIEQSVSTLSGGNQQKVAVAKWLLRDCDTYLFDEPTRGIDVAARGKIYRLFDTLAEAGKAMIIVSSDVDELMETCDRILVLSAGRVVANFVRASWSRDAIVAASFAGYVRPDSAEATQP